MPGLDHFRAYQRTQVAWAAQVSGLLSGESVSCVLVDIGMGGAQISCQSSLPEGAQASLCLIAPMLWEPLVMPARVAWAHEQDGERYHVGLQFLPETGPQLLILADLLGSHHTY